jgi:hypothetical protein
MYDIETCRTKSVGRPRRLSMRVACGRTRRRMGAFDAVCVTAREAAYLMSPVMFAGCREMASGPREMTGGIFFGTKWTTGKRLVAPSAIGRALRSEPVAQAGQSGGDFARADKVAQSETARILQSEKTLLRKPNSLDLLDIM